MDPKLYCVHPSFYISLHFSYKSPLSFISSQPSINNQRKKPPWSAFSHALCLFQIPVKLSQSLPSIHLHLLPWIHNPVSNPSLPYPCHLSNMPPPPPPTTTAWQPSKATPLLYFPSQSPGNIFTAAPLAVNSVFGIGTLIHPPIRLIIA